MSWPIPIQEIYARHIRPLSMVDQLWLVELIAYELAAAISQDVLHSLNLLDIEGLGEEIWPGINAQAYVNELRCEWDQRPSSSSTRPLNKAYCHEAV